MCGVLGCCIGVQNREDHEMDDFPYKPWSVQKHEAELERQRLAKQIIIEFEKRKAYLKERARNKAANDIQRVYRGYRVRKPLRELLGSLAERAKWKRKDDRTRATLAYQVRTPASRLTTP